MGQPQNPVIDKDYTYAATGGMSVTKADAEIVIPASSVNAVAGAYRIQRGFSVGNAGAIKLTLVDGSVLTFADGELAVGSIHPLSVSQVWSTGTDATIFKIYW